MTAFCQPCSSNRATACSNKLRLVFVAVKLQVFRAGHGERNTAPEVTRPEPQGLPLATAKTRASSTVRAKIDTQSSEHRPARRLRC